MATSRGLRINTRWGGGNCSFPPATALCLNAGAMGRRDAESETLIPTFGGGFDVAQVPVAFGWQNSASQGASANEHITPTLDKSKTPAVALAHVHVMPTMMTSANTPAGHNARSGHSKDSYIVPCNGMAVRRLTPVECERLQGFPDGYTDIRERGKPTPDGPRYKALGNSMAVPCMRWIGERIATVDAITAKALAA